MTGGIPIDDQQWFLGATEGRVIARRKEWQAAKVPQRIWEHDPTLWPAAPPKEVVDRTGWLDLPTTMRWELPEIVAFAEEVRREGIRHVVVLGMGGSSLAPDVLARIFGHRSGYPELLVLDSTHPDAVRSMGNRLDAAHTLFLVSSKSGTTLEPLDFYRYFWELVRATGSAPGRHFAAITDPGTPLVKLAEEQGFRRVFLALPTEGGRYSALTAFGLIPAALMGVDVGTILEEAGTMARACGPTVPAEGNPALGLGAVLGELARAGRDKLTLYASSKLAPFPAWVEQLVAESTGKIGRGIVPIVDEPLLPGDRYGSDRLFVEIQTADGVDPAVRAHVDALQAAGHPVVQVLVRRPLSLGREFFRWEFAIACAAMVLEVDPYDQPDVELAKDLARKEMARPAGGSEDPAATPITAADGSTLASAVKEWWAGLRASDYVAIQAYLAPTPDTAEALARLRRELLERGGAATTLGYGPRFLHSTGQLHKGGPNTGLFLQILDRPRNDVPVPGTDYTFGQLIRAQALGDYHALRQKRRRVLRVDLGHDVGGGLHRLTGAIRG